MSDVFDAFLADHGPGAPVESGQAAADVDGSVEARDDLGVALAGFC